MLLLLHVCLHCNAWWVLSALQLSETKVHRTQTYAISLKHLVLANCLDLLPWAPCQVTSNPLFCLQNLHSQSPILPHKHHVPAWHLPRGCKILHVWTVCQFSLILWSQANHFQRSISEFADLPLLFASSQENSRGLIDLKRCWCH